MNKGEFVKAMADKAGVTLKEASVAYDAFVDVVTDALKQGDKVQLVGFGTFEVREKAAREGINPQTIPQMSFAHIPVLLAFSSKYFYVLQSTSYLLYSL